MKLFAKLPLAGAVAVLQHQQQGFRQPKQGEGEYENGRNPQDGVYPIGRRKGELDVQRGGADDGAHDQDDEHRRAVARIERSVIEAATGAARGDVQITVEQLALAAARAAPQKRGVRGAAQDATGPCPRT